MNLVVRAIEASEIQLFRQKMSRAFGGDSRPEEVERFEKGIDRSRTRAAFDGDELVGTSAAFTFDVTVPGGALPMGGTTMVTVQATHRRRGVLRAMMQSHLDEVAARGEPLAGLWASEASIYGRFGYGHAADGQEIRIDARHVAFAHDPPAGAVRLIEADAAPNELPPIYERVRSTRPGMLTRDDARWKYGILFDPEHRREGRSAMRFAVYDGASGPEGYAIYRQKQDWKDFPEGEVDVVDVMPATADAHAALWRYLCRVDLFPNVRYWNLPVDDELPWRITEPRRVTRKIWDSLWIRLMDVRRALEGRTYAAPGALVLGIRDPFRDQTGRYALDAGPDGAACRRVDDPPDLEMDVDVLGALYLGGHRPTMFARAGLIRGDTDALATADRVFPWGPAPWCPDVF
jgi:predicted acetyltransferase